MKAILRSAGLAVMYLAVVGCVSAVATAQDPCEDADGIAALDYLAGVSSGQFSVRPDIIFLDLNMPRKNGFECLDLIRQTKAWEHIPIVIFSTTGQEEMVRKVHEKGANFFIRKPGSFPKLKQAIKQILDIDWTKHNWTPAPENFYYQY